MLSICAGFTVRGYKVCSDMKISELAFANPVQNPVQMRLVPRWESGLTTPCVSALDFVGCIKILAMAILPMLELTVGTDGRWSRLSHMFGIYLPV